jgi:hypothetical protein
MLAEAITLDSVTTLALRLRPVEQIKLVERLMGVLERELQARETPETALKAWQQVYAGLSEKDITEIESLAIDRRNFMRQGE